jgi:hypothetical protein
MESIFTEADTIAENKPALKTVNFKTFFSNARFTFAAISSALAFLTFTY